MRCLFGVLSLLAVLLSPYTLAAENAPGEQGYVGDIELETSEEFLAILQRASQLMTDGALPQDGSPRVVFVLHGPVVRDLLRQNYRQNKDLVDLAASLSALQVVEIKACQTWMGGNSVDERDLQPFVSTVPFGLAEIRRLKREKHYIEF